MSHRSLASFTLALFSLTLLSGSVLSGPSTEQSAWIWNKAKPHSAAPAPVQDVDEDDNSTFTLRQAKRLKQRLQKRHSITPSVKSLAKALEGRKKLMETELTVELLTGVDMAKPEPWTVRVSQVATWIRFVPSITGPRFEADKDAIAQYLSDAYIAELPKPRTLTVDQTVTDKKGVMRAQGIEGYANDGYVYDIHRAAKLMANAIDNGQTSVAFPVALEKGAVDYIANGTTQRLTLLATGLSDASNSPDARIWNVEKLVNEHMNGVVIPQGSVFSFNALLGGPVTLEAGWKEWLGLFGGGAAMTPGAGICQGVTTIHRAAMLAGLPFVERRSHSLFVDHYEKYGIGTDATIFPGVRDMRFRNDTPGPIYVQAYKVGDDVMVNLYGIPDGRSVVMEGPYFAQNAKNNLKKVGRAGLTEYEIGWIRTVTFADGTSKDELLLARYAKPLWGSLVKPYLASTKAMDELHAAAPLPAE